MSGVGQELAFITLACVLTYLIYSTLSISFAAFVCRLKCLNDAAQRMRVWKLALLLPLPVSAAAILTPVPWLPEIALYPPGKTVQAVERIATDPQSSATSGREVADERVSYSRTEGVGSLAAANEVSRERTHQLSEPAHWIGAMAVFVCLLWPLGVGIGTAVLVADAMRLRRMIRSSRLIMDGSVHRQLSTLKTRMGIRRSVRLLESRQIHSPLAAGWLSPCILLPRDWINRITAECREAVLAHELSHISRRDAGWHLIAQIIRRIFWFQPLHVVACRNLRSEMEFAADQQAARVIEDPTDLARSLVQLAEQFINDSQKRSTPPAFVVGMSVHMSGLKRRVTAVLNPPSHVSKPINATSMAGVACLACVTVLVSVPRFDLPTSPPLSGESSVMTSTMKKMVLLTGLLASGIASPSDQAIAMTQSDAEQAGEAVKASSGGGLPEGMNQFSGMLIGTLVDRDIERGNFSVKIDYVARVWENNKARTPRAVVGKRVTVNGVTGKWLDELLLVRPGETVEFEAQHRGGDQLTFPGEWLKKVPAFDPAKHPVPPEAFRGFSGMVTGVIVEKNQTSREIHLRIDSIEKVFKKNRASAARDVIGKEIVLAGFWARMSKPFDKLEKGDRIRAGVLHRVPQSDHFTVIEMAEKIGEKKQKSGYAESAHPSGFPSGMTGFRGILRGTMVSKDIEKGTLVFRADRATRTWKANRASDLESCNGHQFLVKGISGKWVDVLITMKPGDTIEVEAFHNSGEHLDFVSEWLKKVE